MPARLTPLKRSPKGRKAGKARPEADPRRRLALVIDLLEQHLGVPVWDGPKDPLEILVLTILSQNTTDPNALRAYRALAAALPAEGPVSRDARALPVAADGTVDKVKLRLSDAAKAVEPPAWERVAALTRTELAAIIRPAGLPDAKAGAILALLAWLRETTGSYSLAKALQQLGTARGVEALGAIKGIGAKTIAVTMIEALGADLCPVDTHVHRIINRLGITDTGSNRDRTYTLLRDLVPPGKGFSLHHNLLTLGRTVCTAKSPRCGACVLRALCPSAEAGFG